MSLTTHTVSQVRLRVLAALLLSAFVVALGYGTVLPVLPIMVERLLGSSDPIAVARHTALLTAAFAIAPLAAGLPWGRLSDGYGRRPILVAGLVGFSATLALSAIPLDLAFLYVARLLNGGFAAAVLPTTLAFVADTAIEDVQRARTFGWVSAASSLGLLAGPMIGGFASAWGNTAQGGVITSYDMALPLLLVAAFAFAAAMAVKAVMPGNRPLRQRDGGTKSLATWLKPGEIRLLALAAVAAGGLGAFEVGLTLRSRAIAMPPATLGLMFVACMVVMLIVQGLAFSSLFRPAMTRWFIAPSFVVMGIGLLLIPLANGGEGFLATTGLVAASGGLLTPMLAYWVSLISGRGQGAELGLQTAFASLGQTLGSASAGFLIGFYGIPGIAFLLPAIMVIAAGAALTLPGRLAVHSKRSTEAELAGQ